MDAARSTALSAVQDAVGYRFNDISLLNTALTHSSYIKGDCGAGEHNERLEFLGDAVLGFCVGEYLFTHYTGMDEGAMTRVRSLAVRETALYEVAARLGIGEAIRLNRGEEHCGGRNKPSILADAMEAIIGAVYLDGGMDSAKALVMQFAQEIIESAVRAYTSKDAKTILQEYVQKKHMGTIEYTVKSIDGPDHDRTFTLQAQLNGAVLGEGSGRTKRDAGQYAAVRALAALTEGDRAD